MTSALDEAKRRLRAEATRARAAAAAADDASGGGAAEAVSRRLLDDLDAPPGVPSGGVISAYWPMGSELDPRPAVSELHGRGHPIALPVVVGRGSPLLFRAWSPGDALEEAGFNTRVPAADRPELTPRVLLVPLLAFDRRGYRLGYGGGFYDRTLAALRTRGAALAVGLAYAGQEVPEVPRDGNDQHLDRLVTEAEVIRFSSG